MGRGLSGKTREIVARALELWETVYQPAAIVPTVRQYFYALAVEGLVAKDEKGYDQVQRILARARERGEFPWDAVYDALRQVQEPQVWPGLEDFLRTVRRAYRRDKWQDQPRRIEVWIEKDAVRGTIEAVTGAAEIPLLCNRGYTSLTAKNEASRRIAGRPITVLYIGDFDPSGVNMLEETEEWIQGAGDSQLRWDFEIERIAVTEEDLADPTRPHLPVNPRDVRAQDFVQRYGREVIEVEALPPQVLQARLRDAIERHRDAHLWARARRREEDERAELIRRIDG